MNQKLLPVCRNSKPNTGSMVSLRKIRGMMFFLEELLWGVFDFKFISKLMQCFYDLHSRYKFPVTEE